MNKPKPIKKGIIFVIVLAVLCVGFATFAQTDAQTERAAYPAEYTADTSTSDVYMTTAINAQSLVKIYEKLGFNAEGNVAVKMSTGEPPNSNYLRPELIKDLVQKVNGTIVECNTAYGGSRSSTALHKQVAEDHGFTAIANVDIMDEDGSMTIPVPTPKSGTSTITEDYVGAHLENYDSLICLSHFKGHSMAGYGGAIKNMSIGIGSSEGKSWIHSGGTRKSGFGGEQNAFLEAMGDATSAVIDYMDGKVVYINVMNNLSIDCDCDGNPSEPDMHDIGILASYDPVALDQACIDLIYAQKDGDGKSLVQRIESRNGLHTLEHAAQIGIGSREYHLVDIDNEPSSSPATESTPRPQATMTYADGVLTISNLEGSAKLIHASYTNGALSKVEITDAANGTTNAPTRSGDKFMLWSAVGEMIPLSSAVTVETGTYENDPTPSVAPTPDIDPAVSESTVILNMNGTDVRAELYDNQAARSFKEMLPYSVTVSRETDDLCGSVSEELTHDSAEDQDTWSIGEIGWFDGWFTILCDNEEGMPKRTRTIIGKIYDEDIPFMQSLTGSVKIDIRLAQGAETDTEAETKMNVQIGNAVFTATLEDNTAAREFAAMMKEAPVIIKMSDYSGFEKVGSLGRSLTASNSQMTTFPGDIVLYNGNQIVMFYGSNSWSYTKLGHIDDLTGWEAALGSGDITAVFSVADQ